MGSRQRRRYHGGCAAPGVAPGATACLAAALLLLMLAFHCVLSPPLGDGDPPRPQSPTSVGGGSKMGEELWGSGAVHDFYACSNASNEFAGAEVNTESNRYLMIEASGGLNQQRTGIIDAVVVAHILKATLVIPKLDQKSFWEDSSDFTDIFDADYFISSLSKDVKIIQKLPDMISKTSFPYKIRVPRKCTPLCYENRVLPALLRKNVVQLTKFDYRVSNRFEADMLAFSGCYFGGGETERRELGTIRKRWKTLHEANPDRERRHGKCPLTPEEVGLMLRALGFGRGVHINAEILNKSVCISFFRIYFGHKRTIRPNTRKLYSLLLNRTSMSWDTFASKVQTFQKGFMGEPNEVEPGRGGFYEYPLDCICQKTKVRAGHTIDHLRKNANIMENHLTDREGSDVDFVENTALPTGSSNETESEYSHGNGLDIPEIDDMISD
nr:unnamed protein product [Digitaria exilis]